MTLKGGSLWDSMGKGNRVLIALRPILIAPALAGAFICYTVLWGPAMWWPNLPVFGAVLVILSLLAIAQMSTLRQACCRGQLDVECLIRTLGLVFSIFVGFLWVLPEISNGETISSTTADVGPALVCPVRCWSNLGYRHPEQGWQKG
jgi:hypothetical protein